MLNNITYKTKYYLLLLAIAMAGIIIYSLAIKNTISLISEHFQLSEKTALAINAPEQIAYIEMQLKQMEQLIISDKQIDFEQVLLERVAGFCQKNNLVLIEFPKTVTSQYHDYKVYTNRVVLLGGFKEILQFIYEAEQNYGIGKVVSINFKRIKDIRTKRISLTANIFFQNIQITTK